MNHSFLTVLLSPALSFIFAVASVPLVRRFAIRYAAVAQPTPDSHHRKPTPLFGGVCIVGAMLAALAVLGSLPWWMVLAAAILLVAGTIDDVVVLSPLQKLVAELAAALPVLAFAGSFRIAGWPVVDTGLLVFWLLATTNSFNLIDGLDGLASGIGIVAALAISATALLHHDYALASGALAVAGALAGFLVYNFGPASIFMGDGGALPIGLVLGVFALQAGELAHNSRLTIYVFPVLVMLVPLLDTAIVSVTRMATGRGISRRGLDHSHNRLLSLGLSDQPVVTLCWAVAALGAACAVAASVMPHAQLLCALPFMVAAASLVGLFMIDLTFDTRPPGVAYGYLPRLARFILAAGYKWRLVDVALDSVLIAAAYFGAFSIRLDFSVGDDLVARMIANLPWVLLAAYPAFFATGVYRGMWRFTALSDVVRFAYGSALAAVLLFGISLLEPVPIGGSIVALFAILIFNLLVMSRASFQLLRSGIRRLADEDERVLIVGAGELGASAAHKLLFDHVGRLRVVGFVDDDAFKHGKLVEGLPVLGPLDSLVQIHSATGFNQILLAQPLDDGRLAQVWSFANERAIDVRRFSIEMNEMGFAMNAAVPEGAMLLSEAARRLRS